MLQLPRRWQSLQRLSPNKGCVFVHSPSGSLTASGGVNSVHKELLVADPQLSSQAGPVTPRLLKCGTGETCTLSCFQQVSTLSPSDDILNKIKL
jgi:hypothetical protein